MRSGRKAPSLSQLLDKNEEAHKRDIAEITHGHLNESKLSSSSSKHNRQSKKERKLWPPSASPNPIDLIRKESTAGGDEETEEMATTMMTFMFGAAGGLPQLSTIPKNKDGNNIDGNSSSSPSDTNSSVDGRSTSFSNTVCLEHLSLPYLVLPPSKNVSQNYEGKAEKKRNSDKVFQRRCFIKSYLGYPSKQEQHEELKRFSKTYVKPVVNPLLTEMPIAERFKKAEMKLNMVGSGRSRKSVDVRDKLPK